uniref:Ig-like domain-containing protein n=1 Tax=Chrysemys picta bellii TaxID=8478 RepID=A0A8C3P685_CHRPI
TALTIASAAMLPEKEVGQVPPSSCFRLGAGPSWVRKKSLPRSMGEGRSTPAPSHTQRWGLRPCPLHYRDGHHTGEFACTQSSAPRKYREKAPVIPQCPHSRIESEGHGLCHPPLTACLFVNPEGSYPKPSISVSPGGVIPMGGNVTIWCWHQHLGMRILLYKAGDGNYLTHTDPAGSEAEFPITSARREHGGSYTCRYSNRTVRAAYSEPSDPVQIIVAGDYPKPNISLHPSAQVTLGEAVTIRCECRCAGVRVLLSKAGDPDARRSMDPPGDVAAFPIRNVSRGDAGSYSCQYRTKWDPPVWSEPSDPVELVISGEGLRSAAPFTAFQGWLCDAHLVDARFHPTEGTDPAGTQQPDPPLTELAGEGEWEKWNNSSPREQGSSHRCPRGHSGR